MESDTKDEQAVDTPTETNPEKKGDEVNVQTETVSTPNEEAAPATDATDTETAPETEAAAETEGKAVPEAFAPTDPGPAPEPKPEGPKKKWYVVQAYSGYENKVKLSLLERIKQAGMGDSFGEILIPKENVQETRGGNKRVTTRNFYPGYIFVQMDLNEHTWHLIKDTPKVSGFVGGRHPAPVPAAEINAIAQQVAEGAAKPKPRVVFEENDHVRVTDGAFANFTGTIVEVKPEKQKVRVLVSIFGRATPVELDYAQVEKTA